MRGKRKRNLIIAGIILILALLWTWRYISLNRYWRTVGDVPEKKVYSKGEVVPFEKDILDKYTDLDGYSISVDEFIIMDFPDFLEKHDIREEDLKERAREKIGAVYITLYNDTCDDHINLNYLCMHGIDTYIPMDWELLSAANPILEGSNGIHIPHHTKCELILPFSVKKEFLYSDWGKLDQCKLYLHITALPTEKDIQVQ